MYSKKDWTMKGILSLLTLMGSISTVLAIVSISNTYYSNDATIDNGVYLDGVDYYDTVEISSAGVSGSGVASSSELSSGNSTIIDYIQIPNMDIGSSNKIISDNFEYQKSMSSFSDSLSDSSLSSSFHMENGSALAGVWNEFSSAQLNLEIVGCEYDGSQFAAEYGILMDGYGARLSSYEGNCYILQNLSLAHMGQSVETDMMYRELNIPPGAKPIGLNWTNHVESWKTEWASSSLFFNVSYEGVYKADFNLTGKGNVEVQYSKLINSGTNTKGYDEWWINYYIIPEEVSVDSNETSD